MPKTTRPVLKLKPKAERRKAAKMSSSSKKKKSNNSKDSRWTKGHSCESNPSVRKFRDGVSNLQFQFHPVAENSLLTMDNLEHLRDEEDMDDDDEDYDVLSEDVKSLTVSDARTRLGSMSSYKTFASGWSKCSNKAFERFLLRFKADSALHKDMLSILAATTEVINSFGGKHSDTEYFATFISTLDKCEPQQYHPMMALVCMIIAKVPESIIRVKFNEIYPKISLIFSNALDANEATLIRLCCDALGKILCTQECVVFDCPEADQNSAYYSILKCSLHDHPKVRRKGRQVIRGLLHRHNERKSSSLTKLVLGWILDQLAAYPTCGSKVALDVLSLLQFTWTFIETINPSASKKVFESVLRVMSGGDSSILKIGFTLFTTVFQKGIGLTVEDKPEDSLTPKLICVIWDLRPDWRNNETFLSWIRCILDGVVRLLDQQDENGPKYLPLLIEAVSPSWPSTFGQHTCQLLSDYIQHIVSSDISLTVIEDCFLLLSKNLIAIPPNPHCLKVLDALLDAVSPNQFGKQSREVLLQLVPLYSTNTSEMSRTLGRFVKAFGVENLWNSVDTATKHTVILPLLRENLCQSSFTFWTKNILPLATQPGAPENMKLVVWESFVGFCRDPKTVADFPAETLGKTIATKPNVRLSALAGLRQFCLWTQCRPILEKYSKNYLPILFNLYIKEKVDSKKEETKFNNPGHAEAIGCTISDYLPFCPREFVHDLLNRAFTKLIKDKNFTDEERTPLLDLIANLASQELDLETLKRLMDILTNLINDPQQQKRAYRILCSLVKHESLEDSVKDSIIQLLREGNGKAKSNAQALRLECLNYLIEKDSSLIDEFLPEAVLNLLSVNIKARKLAVRFAVQACHQYKSLDRMLGVIQVGLKSTNTFVRCCTVNFMTLAHAELKPKQPNAELIQACLDQIRESKQPKALKRGGADGSPCKESLGFLSLNLSLFKTLMGPYASSIGHILSLPGSPRKEVNKILARMIKVFGVAGLNAVLPNANDPKMHIRIKNLQKKIRKLKEAQAGTSKKLRDENNGEDNDGGRGEGNAASDESEDEFSGLTSSSSKTSKRTLSTRGLVIKEGVVDFLDPKNITGALLSKPKQSKPGDDFKLTEDGRLIIEMEEEMEKAGTKRKRKMDPLNRNNSAADDDDDDDEYETRSYSSKARSYSSKASKTSSRFTARSKKRTRK